MRLIYATDLHGRIWKYERLLDLACRLGVDAVVNGGDMFPHGGDLFSDQRRFITDFLECHFAACAAAGIRYLCMPANDDLGVLDSLFNETCGRHAGVHSIAGRCVETAGWSFVGMNLVPDCPFRLKDRCRLDTADFVPPHQFGRAVLSTEQGFREVPDWPRHAASAPTIEQELSHLPAPADLRRTIYVIHTPPRGLGLDVCSDGRQVGSAAVRTFLGQQGPRLSFHGHIHESPFVTGVWQAPLERTLCVQPGQTDDLVYVTVDTATLELQRMTVPRG